MGGLCVKVQKWRLFLTGGLCAELLKYRRTFLRRLIVGIPWFFAVCAVWMGAIMDKKNLSGVCSGRSWLYFLAMVFNWWPVIFLPLGMGLFAALTAAQEKRAENYRALRTRNVSLIGLWINKAAGMAIYSLLSALMLLVVVTLTGLLFARGIMPAGGIVGDALPAQEIVPILRIAEASFLCWAASLALIPIQLAAAVFGGILASLGLGFAGMIAGVLLAPTRFWLFCPWSYATRLMSPVIGVHPNGVMLERTDPLLDPSVLWPGVLLSVFLAAVFTVVTGIWFSKKEM